MRSIGGIAVPSLPDPWSAQGVNATLAPSLLHILIEGGAHHTDLGSSRNPRATPEDSAAVKAARAAEEAALRAWLDDISRKRAAAEESVKLE